MEHTSVLERFLRYVKIDTQSGESDQVPSTEKQWNLARLLAEELKQIGASNVRLDPEHAYVYAEIPASGNLPETKDRPEAGAKVPVLGFIAHMDTSNAVSGADVNPRIVKDYDGGEIVLNAVNGLVLSPSEYPDLLKYRGRDLVVTDGNTLLGADDKAGIAEIMAMAEYLLSNPSVPHGEIRIGFTPDEEVGRGVDYFDVPGFGADYAYTVDGGEVGEIEYENFNAASARLHIHGTSIHPGSAKGKMINAVLLASEFQNLLPVYENPSSTEGYEGFYHPDSIAGNVDEVQVDYIIRDHDMDKFEQKKQFFRKTCDFLNEKYGKGTFTADISDSYYNMKEKILPHMHLIDNAKKAMEEAGVKPIILPIRGGTDGARLSYMGLPCPNLCTGGQNCHGRYEYVCVQSMETVVDILLNLVQRYTAAK